MTQLLILAAIAIVGLLALLAWQARAQGQSMNWLLAQQLAERSAWRDERRFLIDRAIANHIGEVVALEREDSRKQQMNHPSMNEDRPVRPLLEGLS